MDIPVSAGPPPLPPFPPPPSPPLPLPPPPMSPATVTSVSFSGITGDIALILMKNIFLAVITLGIYRFWGRVRMRQYLWQHVHVGSFALLYTGTAKELLFGFFKLLVLLILFFAVQHAPGPPSLGQVLSGFALTLLGALAVLGSRRYRLSRTRLCNVAFGVDGALGEFLLLYIVTALLSVLSFGTLAPLVANDIYNYLTSHSRWGNKPFRYTGKGSDVMRIWLACLPGLIFTFGFYWPWYSARIRAYRAQHTHIDAAHLEVTITGSELACLYLKSILATVASLGLAIPWVVKSYVAFFAEHTRIVGEVDMSTVGAAAASGSSMFDAMDDSFGISLEL